MPDSPTHSHLTLETLHMLTTVLQVLIAQPSKLRILPIEGSQSVVSEVGAEDDDLPKIIGRGGRTASALRTLLWNLACKHGRNYLLLIVDPSSPPGSAREKKLAEVEEVREADVIRRRKAA